MKLFLSIILLCVINHTKAQNIEYNKVIDEKVDIPEYYWLGLGFNYIRYYKLPKNQILRIEDLKVQLLNSTSEVVWKKDFERILGGTKKFNRIEISANESFIYVSQHNYSMTKPGVGKEIFKIFKLDYTGAILKQITFNEINPIEDIIKMELINGDLYVISRTAPVGKGFNIQFDHHAHITRLDENLKIKGNILELPFFVENSEYDSPWKYCGIYDDKFTFKRSFSKEKNGDLASCRKCETGIDYVESYSVDFSLDKSNLSTSILNRNDFDLIYNEKFKYDTTEFQLYSGENIVKCGGGIPTRLVTNENDQKVPLTLKNKNGASKDIISLLEENDFDVLVKSGKVYVHCMMENPITNGIMLYLSPFIEGTYGHFLSFNNNLELISINLINNIGYMPFEQNLDYSFVLGFTGYKDGKNLTEEGIGAFEYAINNSVQNQNTIINYEDYQLLFIDDRKAKLSRVLKIVK